MSFKFATWCWLSWVAYWKSNSCWERHTHILNYLFFHLALQIVQDCRALEDAHGIQETYVQHVVFVNVSQLCINTLAALTQSHSIDEHVILILKHSGSVFWRLAPACVSLRSPIQSQMAAGIMHPSLPRSAWLLSKWRWYTIMDSNTHPASISCLSHFTSIFLLHCTYKVLIEASAHKILLQEIRFTHPHDSYSCWTCQDACIHTHWNTTLETNRFRAVWRV